MNFIPKRYILGLMSFLGMFQMYFSCLVSQNVIHPNRDQQAETTCNKFGLGFTHIVMKRLVVPLDITDF